MENDGAENLSQGFRIFQLNVGGQVLYEMREVAYENGIPITCSATAVEVVALSLKDLRDLLHEMQAAILMPILDGGEWHPS